jgi:hypothetical protein
MIIVSAIVAHIGWHWMTERADVLWRVEWPSLDGPGLAVLARWIAALLLATGGPPSSRGAPAARGGLHFLRRGPRASYFPVQK